MTNPLPLYQPPQLDERIFTTPIIILSVLLFMLHALSAAAALHLLTEQTVNMKFTIVCVVAIAFSMSSMIMFRTLSPLKRYVETLHATYQTQYDLCYYQKLTALSPAVIVQALAADSVPDSTRVRVEQFIRKQVTEHSA
jgi:hypothetical protein